MICVDTNYLIMALVPGSREAERLIDWAESGKRLYVPAIVWYEFLCGPVDAQHVSTMRAVLHDIVPFDDAQAEEAARLFNATGRRRKLRVEAMVAAAATSRESPLASRNSADFEVFLPHGLQLI